MAERPPEPHLLRALKFVTTPSESTNDHETRIMIDGLDILSGGEMGLDPPDFFGQPELVDGGRMRIGRCSCGVVGCGDVGADVSQDGKSVIWHCPKGQFHFDLHIYHAVIEEAGKDRSWEDAKRTAERLVDEVMRGTVWDGKTFRWSSARIGYGTINLAYENPQSQLLVEIGWDGQRPETAVAAAKAFRRERGL
jgi:hypothetical protein